MRENDTPRTRPLIFTQAVFGIDGSGDVGVSLAIE